MRHACYDLFIDKVNERIVFMKKLTFILIGAGNRGKCYTQHAYMHGGYELVGIADPNEQTREFMREHYHTRSIGSCDTTLPVTALADHFPCIASIWIGQ